MSILNGRPAEMLPNKALAEKLPKTKGKEYTGKIVAKRCSNAASIDACNWLVQSISKFVQRVPNFWYHTSEDSKCRKIVFQEAKLVKSDSQDGPYLQWRVTLLKDWVTTRYLTHLQRYWKGSLKLDEYIACIQKILNCTNYISNGFAILKTNGV